ncbi:hypothetical protein Tco_0045983 [Tanacetum coccineum]
MSDSDDFYSLDPPSPDYVPGPEEPEQAPPSPIYVPFVPEPVYPEFLPVDDEIFPAEEQPMPAADSPTHQSPGYIPESDPEEDPEEEDPEEDPADYPADRGDDRDDEESSDDDDDAEEEEHLAPADPAAVAYSADQDPYLAYRVTARMSIRPHAPAPFLSEEVAERLLALPTPPPSPLSPYSSPLPQIPSPPLPIPSQPPNSPTYVEGSLGSRAAGIRQRDALPSPVHETEMPEICLPLCKRPCRTTPGPGYEVGESSAAGTARQVGPATARADLYGFANMLDAAPGRQTSRELGYGITDTWDDLEDEIIYSQLDDARHDRALLRARVNYLGHQSMDDFESGKLRGHITSGLLVMAQRPRSLSCQAEDRMRQDENGTKRKAHEVKPRYNSTTSHKHSYLTSVTSAQLQARGSTRVLVTDVLAARATNEMAMIAIPREQSCHFKKAAPVARTRTMEMQRCSQGLCSGCCRANQTISCGRKIVRIPFGSEILIFHGDGSRNKRRTRLNIISCTKTQKYLLKGCHVFLAHITIKETGDKSKKQLQDVPIVKNFPEVFPEDLPGLPHTRQVEFHIDLVPGAAPVARAPYRLAPSEMKELADQLQELSDKGFIRPSSSPWAPQLSSIRQVERWDPLRMCIDYRELNN